MKLNRLNIEAENFYAIGDIHGSFNKIVEMIKRYDIANSCIIVCGDCGFGFYSVGGEKENISKLNKLAKKTNNIIIMIRGNHDNPMYFSKGLVNTDNVMAVPDYTVINDKILCVGGATSIDRSFRIEREAQLMEAYASHHPAVTIESFRLEKGGLYWPDEAPVYDEEAMNELNSLGIKIKHVCTHTCPSFCEPQTKDGIVGWIAHDPGLGEVIDNERKVMDQLWNNLVTNIHPLETWTYGHYHRHFKDEHDGVVFTMLDAIISDYSMVDWIELIDKK